MRYGEPHFDGLRDGETQEHAIRRLMARRRAAWRSLPRIKRRFVGAPCGDFEGVVTGLAPDMRCGQDWQSLPVVIRGQAGQFRYEYGKPGHANTNTVTWEPLP